MKLLKSFIKTIDKKFLKKYLQDIISRKVFGNFKLNTAVLSDIQRWIFFFEHIKNNNIEGDIVECGVGNGLSLSIIIYLKKYYNLFNTKIYACDSFKGFPKTQQNSFNEQYFVGDWSHTNLNYVKENLTKFGITEKEINDTVFIEGYFKNTLQNFNSKKISLIHLDCDLYQSYKDCFQNLHKLISNNGIIILDEYFYDNKFNRFPGAVAATDEFIIENNLKISFINNKGYIFKK